MTASAPLRADELIRVLKRPNTVLLFATPGSSSTEVQRLSQIMLLDIEYCGYQTKSLVVLKLLLAGAGLPFGLPEQIGAALVTSSGR